MELPIAIRQLTELWGDEIITESRILPMLGRKRCFTEFPEYKQIYKSIINVGYAHRVLNLLHADDWRDKLNELFNTFYSRMDYDENDTFYVFESIAYGIGLCWDGDDSIPVNLNLVDEEDDGEDSDYEEEDVEEELYEDIETDAYTITKRYHEKKNINIFVVKLKQYLDEISFEQIRKQAKDYGKGYYSSFHGVNGFVFYSFEDAKAFVDEAFGTDIVSTKNTNKKTMNHLEKNSNDSITRIRTDEFESTSFNSLLNAVQIVVSTFGDVVVTKKTFVNMLDDNHAFRECPALKRIFQVFVNDGVFENLTNSHTNISQVILSKEACSAAMKYGFQEILIRESFAAVLLSCGMAVTEETKRVENEKNIPFIDVTCYSEKLVDVEDYSALCADYYFDEDNEDYLEDRNGVIYSEDKMALISKGDFGGYSYSVRYGTRYIANEAWKKGFDEKEELIPLEIRFPETLIAIGEEAFKYNNLGDMIIPKSVKSILNDAFYGCVFSNLTLQEGLEYIGNGAFGTTNITDITIPSTVKYVGGNAFPYGINISNRSKHLSVGKQLVCNNERTIVFCCFSDKEKIVLPNTIEIIAQESFQFHDMQEIVLGKSLRVIGKRAFLYCQQLRIIELPETLETIEDSAFKGCCNLYDIVIPYSVKYIGKNVFENCEQLSNVISLSPFFKVVDDALYDIRSKTLISYYGIDKYYTVSDGTKIIGEKAFANNTNIQRIKLPKSVASIELGAFWYCSNLRKIEITNKKCGVCESAFWGTKFEKKYKKS